MVILVDENTKVIVQGITGRQGSFHTKLMLEYGTKIVAGVTPGKGGIDVHGVPVYNTVEEAVAEHPDANTSIIFVPARFAADAVYEAVDAGLKLVVVITEHIPVHDTMRFVNYARIKGARVVGPNGPGVISPGKSKVGIMPGNAFRPGKIGIVSRSGTLTYEISSALSRAGYGQSTAVGVGGDPIVLIGEIGGDIEERVAAMVAKGEITKPMVGYIVGRTAPPGKRMGHAGAIISMGTGRAEDKVRALQEAGVPVAETPSQLVSLVKKMLEGR